MPKYGRGLPIEIYEAANQGIIPQPFNVSDCRKYAQSKGWNVPESYMRVVLANSEANRTYSKTYKDLFIRDDKGRYFLNPNFRE